MSNHLFGHYRRSDDSNPKNLTPKGSKYSPKISPVFSSVRSGMMLKQDISKGKIIKPATAKNMNDSNSGQYFHAKDNVSRKPYSSSNKKLELTSKSAIKRSFEYQPRSKSKSPIKHQEEIIREEIFTQPKSFIPTDRGIRVMENDHSPLPKLLLPISNFEPAKFSNKPNGNIKAFAASTNQGPVREYNEDRVAIILTIPKPKNYVDWKKAAYFGVFDGHGGMDCADFLRDNLHLFISREKKYSHVNLVSRIRWKSQFGMDLKNVKRLFWTNHIQES